MVNIGKYYEVVTRDIIKNLVIFRVILAEIIGSAKEDTETKISLRIFVFGTESKNEMLIIIDSVLF